jgi:hypothetical protein
MSDPASVIQRQLDAYNKKDIVGWLATYADDAIQFTIEGVVLADGKDQIKANILTRFQEPNLYAQLIERKTYEDVVIDHELITRDFPEGRGTVEMLCIYLIKDSLIIRGTFKVFNKTLL